MKIILWGAGDVCKRLIRLADKSGSIQIKGITYTGYSGGEEFVSGIKVICAEDLLATEYDYIVIASTDYEEEIREALAKKVDRKVILNVAEFYHRLIKNSNPEYYDNEFFRFAANSEHNTLNKWVHYFRVYDRFLRKFKKKPLVFLEIGVYKGGSLQMWREYFGDDAQLIGVDIDDRCKEMQCRNTNIEIGSQEDEEFWKYIKKKYPHIDVLVDDGGHTMNQQKVTFNEMFPHISNDGIYICEDTHTSFMRKFTDGVTEERFIDYVKNMVDDLHRGWVDRFSPNYNTQNMFSINFYDSIIVIEKECDEYIPFIVPQKDEVKTMDFYTYQL